MRLAAAFAVIAIGASIAGCGSSSAHGATHTLPAPGPFFSNLHSVRTALSHNGVAIAALTPGAAPESVMPHPDRSFRIRTRGGTRATVLVYPTPQKALRARASAGPLTVLGNNVLAVIGRRGSDIHRVQHAIGSLDHRPS